MIYIYAHDNKLHNLMENNRLLLRIQSTCLLYEFEADIVRYRTKNSVANSHLTQIAD